MLHAAGVRVLPSALARFSVIHVDLSVTLCLPFLSVRQTATLAHKCPSLEIWALECLVVTKCPDQLSGEKRANNATHSVPICRWPGTKAKSGARSRGGSCEGELSRVPQTPKALDAPLLDRPRHKAVQGATEVLPLISLPLKQCHRVRRHLRNFCGRTFLLGPHLHNHKLPCIYAHLRGVLATLRKWHRA